MENQVAVRDPAEIMENVIVKGDLSKLTPAERGQYYMKVCESVGLNPLTKPFEYITLNGKLTLYALRACTDQLRSVHKVSVEELAESEREGVFIVTAKVKNGEGRTDIAKGAVTINGLKGDALANAMMKAETKAKRRATLSLCGLGFLDETEIETIPGAARNGNAPVASRSEPKPIEPAHDANGEIKPCQIAVPMKADDSGSDWISWGGKYVASIMTSQTPADVLAWGDSNSAALATMEKEAPKVYARVKANIEAVRGKFDKAAA